MSVAIAILIGGILVYGTNREDDTVVVLDNQKSEMDSQLAIKSMDNIKFSRVFIGLMKEKF